MSLWPSKNMALKKYGPQKIWPSKSMGLRKYGPKKLWPSKKEWSLGLRTMLLWSRMMPALFWPSKSQLSFTTLLFLREWFLGACNMDFVILLPLPLHLPFTLYPSPQLHPSLRPSPYTHQLYYLWTSCFVSAVTRCLMSLLVSGSVSTHSQQRAFLTHPTHYRRPPIVWKHSHSYGR